MIPTTGCSWANRLSGEDPIGTATHADQLLLVEVPRPWERTALSTAHAPSGLREACAGAARRGARATVLLFEGASLREDRRPDSDTGRDGSAALAAVRAVRVVHLARSAPGASFRRSTYLAPEARVAGLVGALLDAGTRAASGDGGRPDAEAAGPLAAADAETRGALTAPAADVAGAPAAAGGEAGGILAADAVRSLGAVPVVPARRELFVCTHAGRDACCGRYGDAAYRWLRDRYGAELDVWRVSHLGGHRFAPTLLELPEGRCWGKLTPEALAALVDRSRPPAALRDAYRGWCALPAPAQVLERELLSAYGWAWTEARVRATAVRVDDGVVRVTIDAVLPDGRLVHAEADVADGEPVITPLSCGREPAAVAQRTLAWRERPAALAR